MRKTLFARPLILIYGAVIRGGNESLILSPIVKVEIEIREPRCIFANGSVVGKIVRSLDETESCSSLVTDYSHGFLCLIKYTFWSQCTIT